MLMRRWSPPSPLPITTLDDNKISQNQRICLRRCKLIVISCIAIIFLCFFTIYTIQKERFFKEEYRYKKQNQYEHEQQLLFDTYIQDISNILIKFPDRNHINESSLFHIRTKTILLLKYLEIQRKKDILLFLYETNLIKTNQLNLREADFNNVEIICSDRFHYLYLPGIVWSNAVFINCHLINANLNQVNLMNARFINSTLQNTSLIETNLEQSHFIQSIILQNDFNSACLRQADFLQAQIVQGNNFTNADLYQAKLTNEQFEGKKFTILKHDFRHARFPNGTFSLPNPSRNLIQNGNAEIDCLFNNQTAWTTNNYSIILSTDTIENDTSHWGNCSFILTAAIRVYQTIQLHSYKLLIDTNNARISFAAFANCEQSYFEINMYRSDHILHQSKIYSKPIKSNNNTVMFQYGEDQYHLPMYTRYITIYFGIETFQIDRACYFDNIALFIF